MCQEVPRWDIRVWIHWDIRGYQSLGSLGYQGTMGYHGIQVGTVGYMVVGRVPTMYQPPGVPVPPRTPVLHPYVTAPACRFHPRPTRSKGIFHSSWIPRTVPGSQELVT